MLGHGTAAGKRRWQATGSDPNICARGKGIQLITTDGTETYGNHRDEQQIFLLLPSKSAQSVQSVVVSWWIAPTCLD
jgi:hypothetical protein